MDHDYTKGPKGPSRNGYRNGCRCEGCTESGQQYLAERRARERGTRSIPAPGESREIHSHGVGGYQRGCRCQICKADMKDLRSSRLPADPVDWSDVEHLKVGFGVRTRANG